MLKKLFGFDSTKTTIRTEIVAGITTFLTMSYILAVNPTMFSELDMPGGAVFTATALAAIVGCLAMAFVGKLPFGLAPGMGLNAFFVYTVCMGSLLKRLIVLKSGRLIPLSHMKNTFSSNKEAMRRPE